MSEPIHHIVGSDLSPYVCKVLVCMGVKGLRYTIDPTAPFLGGDAFERLSPLRRVLVLIDGPRVINDSSVICQYLEDRHPTPSLYLAAGVRPPGEVTLGTTTARKGVMRLD